MKQFYMKCPLPVYIFYILYMEFLKPFYSVIEYTNVLLFIRVDRLYLSSSFNPLISHFGFF